MLSCEERTESAKITTNELESNSCSRIYFFEPLSSEPIYLYKLVNLNLEKIN